MQNFPDNEISGIEGLDLISPPNSTRVALAESSPRSSSGDSMPELIPLPFDPLNSILRDSVKALLRSDLNIEETMSDPVRELNDNDTIDEDFFIHDRAIISDHSTAVEPYKPAEWEVKRSTEWRDRQKRKLISALRRDIEWLVERNEAITIEDLLEEDRIRDLTDRREDIIEAVSLSQSVCLGISQGIQTVSNQ